VQRRFITLGSILSLMMCVGTLVLWVRSYHHLDAMTYESPRRDGLHLSVESVDGWILLQAAVQPAPADLYGFGVHAHSYELASGGTDERLKYEEIRWYGCIGIFNDEYEMTVPEAVAEPGEPLPSMVLPYRVVYLPDWLVTAVLFALAAPPLARAAVRRSRQRRSLCATCGYNLTGNTSGVCPECGTQMTARVKACGGGASTSPRRRRW
jgi:predicted RNA-binding Zn-ribbon protein involved in translation (DUF1610 family)